MIVSWKPEQRGRSGKQRVHLSVGAIKKILTLANRIRDQKSSEYCLQDWGLNCKYYKFFKTVEQKEIYKLIF